MQKIVALLAILGASSPVCSTNSSKPLVPFVLEPLPLGSITPQGWLRDQMQLMADGLAGHEHDFYDYVADSTWLGGGSEYSGLDEGFPYWFNGLVPLAYGLGDQRLKQQVHSAAQYVLDHQADDGWLGPEVGQPARSLWGRFPLCLGLMQLVEANSTWTTPIVDSLQKYTTLMHSMLEANGTGYINQGPPLSLSADNWSWGRIRSQDMMITLQWLYEQHPGNMSDVLLDSMKLLHQYGLNWEDWYNEAAYFGRGLDKDLNLLPFELTDSNYPFEHGVNVGQGLKAVAVIRRFTHNDSLISTAMAGVNWTMSYHGAPSGTIVADERLVGMAPYSGGELCTSVETMYSLSYLYQALGDPYYADRAELTAFNSLPAMLTPDWWGRQYMEASNQPNGGNVSETPFYNSNNWSMTFGLEPNYPCCTVNHPQGWPKFLSALFAKVGKSGIAHTLLAPGDVKTDVGGRQIMIRATTGYPFMDDLHYVITTSNPLDFYVRVPSWAGSDSSIRVKFGGPKPVSPDPITGLHKISLGKGTWNISYSLQSYVRTEARANETVSVYKGALLYALDVPSMNISSLPRLYNDTSTFFSNDSVPPQSKDWQYFATGKWNIAIEPQSLQYQTPTLDSPAQLANPIFAPDGNFGTVAARGCEIDWPLYLDSVPGFPPTGDAKKCLGEPFEVRLIPYGSAKTHMAEIPTIAIDSA